MTLFYAAMQHVWADFSIIVQTGTGSCVCTIGCRTLLSRTSDNLFVEFNVDLTHQLRPRARRVTGTPAHGCAQRSKSGKGGWCLGPESNQRHADFQSAALPTELPRPGSPTAPPGRPKPCPAALVSLRRPAAGPRLRPRRPRRRE